MTTKTPAAGSRFDQQQDLQAIDALRGYAVLLVICMHVFIHVPTLAWPVKRLLLLGHAGVQLFFLVSAVTLLMSWSRDTGHAFGARARQFFVNRWFRIAPLYFLAIAFYWLFEQRTLDEFNLPRLVGTLLFYNAWSPYLLPTVGGWMPAPGGWSISVEFMFYLVFPLLAMLVTSMRRALLFVLLAYALMLAASVFGQGLYPEVEAEARNRFLFFWPPNQLVVFAIGFLLYRAVKSATVQAWGRRSRLDAGGATALLVAALLAVQFYPGKGWELVAFLLPQHLLLSLLFAGWALFMLLKPRAAVAPGTVVEIGKMSFSIYLINFAALASVETLLSMVWPFGVTGVLSIVYAGILFGLATFASYRVARFTYRYVERPCVRFGKALHGGGRPAWSAGASDTGAK